MTANNSKDDCSLRHDQGLQDFMQRCRVVAFDLELSANPTLTSGACADNSRSSLEKRFVSMAVCICAS